MSPRHQMFSRQKAFERGRREWYSIGAVFTPYQVTLPTGEACLGCQRLVVTDVESQCVLEPWTARRPPAPFTVEEIQPLLERTFSRHGRARKGVVFLPTAWRSSQALQDDATIREQVARAHLAGLSWEELPEAERLRIGSQLEARGLSVVWSDLDLPFLASLLGS